MDYDPCMDEFRELLRSRLTGRGDLARLSEASGIASHVIGRWRDGEGRPTDTNLKRLAPALGVSYEDLAKMCGYLPGEPSAALDPRLGAFLAAIESGWQAMDDTTREVAERGARALFATTTAAANTSSDPTATHTGRPINGRRRGLLPPLESHQRWGAGILAAICSPFARSPVRLQTAATC